MLPLSARCIVVIDQTRYDSAREGSLIQSVSVDLTTDKTSEAVVTFADPTFAFTDRYLDETGMRHLEVRIWMGYGEELGEPWFKGTLAGHEHDGEYATFRFHDPGAKMKREKKQRYHTAKTDFEILRSIAGEYGLRFTVLDEARDSEPHESIIQRGSDWDFARTIARRAGVRLWFEGDTLFAREAGKRGAASTTLVYRDDFLIIRPVSFSYKLPESRRGRHRSVRVHARGSGGRRLTGEDTTDGRGRVDEGGGKDLPHHTKRGAERRARAKRLHAKESAFEHRIRLLPASGVTRINLRSVVGLDGCGEFYGGEYVVHSLRKDWRTGKLTDDVTLRRDLGQVKPKTRRRRARRGAGR